MRLGMRHWPRSRVIALGVVCLLCAGVALMGWLKSTWRGLPYRDSFTLGNTEEWTAYAGNWNLVGGAIKNDSDERGAKLVTGSPYWKSYAIEADVQLLGTGDAGLLMRASDVERGVDSYTGYYAGLRTSDQSLVLGRAEHGWYEFPPVPMPGGVVPGKWYRLRVSAQGCTIGASATASGATDSAQIRINDPDCVQSGRVGLRSMGAGGMWRNIAVARLTSAAPDSGALAAAPPHVALYPTGQGVIPWMMANGRVSTLAQRPLQAKPIQSIRNLRLFSITRPAHVVVRGAVILTNPALYIQDSTGGVRIGASQPAPVRVGDEVEVEGDVYPNGLSAAILHATEKPLGGLVAPIPPLSVTADQAATGAYDSMFIEVEGHLSKDSNTAGKGALDFSNGLQTFRAVSNSSVTSTLFSKLEKDSIVRLRGVCSVSSDLTNHTVPFALIVNSPEDVKVLAGPPWWSVDHIILLAIAMLCAGFFVHLMLSRAEDWRLHAVINERERLAHEIHDTLAQSFAGVGFQLRAMRNRIARNSSSSVNVQTILDDLNVASELVRHSHDEARRSIAILRPEALESTGLVAALEQSARRMVARGSVVVEASYAGEARRLPLRVLDSLYRIGQEAFANAIQHGHPKRITIRLIYEPSGVTLVLQDDGTGFVLKPESSGFGINGMRHRAEAIHATLEIESNPGIGTRVTVQADTPRIPWWRRLAYSRPY